MIIPEIIQAPISQIDQIIEVNSHGINLMHISNKDFNNNLCKLIEMCEQNLPKYQDFVYHLQMIEFLCLCGQLNRDLLQSKFLGQITRLNSLIRCPLSGVRSLVCRTIAAVCSQEIYMSMNLILEYLVDLLDNSEFDLFARQGWEKI
jgi:hypothetical protein